MNPNNDLENMKQFAPEIDANDAASINDFIKQLEAKERDLRISSEIVIEIDDFDPDDRNLQYFAITEKPVEASNIKNIMPSPPIPNGSSFSAPDEEKSLLKQQIAKLEADSIGLTENLRRRQNDFDNFKSRVERERGETFINQLGNLATQMLPVLDNLNRALEFAERHNEADSDDFHQFFEGIVLVSQQLNDVFAEMGVSPVASIGEAFDPHFHEAVATEETDEIPPNTITGEFLRGYRIGSKLIRAAMVKVSVPTKPKAEKLFSESDLASVDDFFQK